MDPRAKKEFTADYDYEFDEKHKTVSVTEQGVEKAERFLGIEHLYRAENGALVNHLHQALKAESLYKKDVDYAVIDGEVKIIDEFTGRILDGRRWSEGLHQAVEAKEGVRVREENQTLATITLQNYFRMYDKLAGMSGTALTEATEFMKIYKVGVVEIPTNRPMVRKDKNDQIYKTREGKWRAVAREIQERHDKGQPVLVGTISVEVSELLSERLRKIGRAAHGAQRQARARRARGLDHRRGGRARRGHDRHQHGRPRRGHQARRQPRAPDGDRARQARPAPRRPGLRGALRRHPAPRSRSASRPSARSSTEAGGLFIVGTERHESRRIDNQLRGRAGRQGDPGESRFFLSAEDDLVRLFAGDRIYKILDRLGPKGDDGEEEPIEAKMLTKQIEGAQRKVEEQNYLIRKRVLEYDDVMNQQREVVYKYRDEVLEGRDMADVAREQIEEVIGRLVDEYTPGDFADDWDLDELWVQLDADLPRGLRRRRDRPLGDRPRGAQADARRGRARRSTTSASRSSAKSSCAMLERYLILQIIDQRWREHLYDMDYLREGIHLRGFAQIEPLVAYKNEAFTLFEDLMNSIWSDFARMIYNVEVEVQGPRTAAPRRRRRRSGPRRSSQGDFGALEYYGGTLEDQPTAYGNGDDGAPREEPPVVAQRRVERERERSAATIRAGAAQARSSRSATEREPALARLRACAPGRFRSRPEGCGASAVPR